jgi:aspartate/methionine/tyrosine aminotransferase
MFPKWMAEPESNRLCEALLVHHGGLLLPGSYFDGAYCAHFRIGFGGRDFQAALPVLTQFLEQETRRFCN